MAFRPKYKKTLAEMAKRPKPKDKKDKRGWGEEFRDGFAWERAASEEKEYIKSLKNPKDILAYIDQREEEVFLDNL